MENERKIELLLNHLESEITHEYADFENCDYQLLSESTTDGYEVYIFKEPFEDTIVCENVYYYNHNLGEQVIEVLMEGNTTVFIDEYEYIDLYLEDDLLAEFTELVDEIIEEFEGTEEELNYLKEEYGIEDEEIEIT